MKGSLLAEKALVKHDWPLVDKGGLKVICAPLLSQFDNLAHAFTTRTGGQSQPPLQWFNLGRHWPDEQSREDALINRRRLCQALGLADWTERLTVPGQKHTTNIHVIDPHQTTGNQLLMDRDGAATDATGYPILLHFADCVPVIIFDPKRAALCVVHAGWKGTAGGISRLAVQLLCDKFNCRTENICAAIGPAIGSCCYPTGDDVAQQLCSSVEHGESLIAKGDGQPRPDLKAVNAMQLLESGVEQIDVSSWCTACRPDIFYSHRQAKGQTGRQGALACITQSAANKGN